nr:hypothetical protein [Tanacetum cinerariifolium]
MEIMEQWKPQRIDELPYAFCETHMLPHVQPTLIPTSKPIIHTPDTSLTSQSKIKKVDSSIYFRQQQSQVKMCNAIALWFMRVVQGL